MLISALPPHNAAVLLPLVHQVHALHVDAQPEIYPPITDDMAVVDFLLEWLGADAVTAYVAGPKDAPLGYLIVELMTSPANPLRYAETVGMLHHICVDLSHRKLGIAKSLIAHARETLRAQGATNLMATYASFNAASAALMTSAGLTPTTIIARSFSL